MCLLALLIDSALYYNKVHAGVTISGQAVGGLTRDEATAAITRLVKDAQSKPITLVSGDRSWSVLPKDVGTKIDVAGGVSEAMDVSRGSNFLVDLFQRFKLYFSDKDVPLRGTVENKMMDELTAGVSQEVDIPPVNAGLAFDGTTIKVVEGQKGRPSRSQRRTRGAAVRPSCHQVDGPHGGQGAGHPGGGQPRRRRSSQDDDQFSCFAQIRRQHLEADSRADRRLHGFFRREPWRRLDSGPPR